MKLRDLAFACALATPCAAPAAGAETLVSFSGGLDYSSGAYGGSADTEMLAAPLSARVSANDWALRVSIPYVSITGPADVSDEGGSGGGATARIGTESGFGDTTLTLSRSFRHLWGSDFYFDAAGRVKLPSGDEARGLGVGATDYGLTGLLGVNADSVSAYFSAGRRFLGDRGGLDRQDGWQAAVGASLGMGEKTRLGASYSWRDASLEGGADPSEIGAFVSYRMSDALRVSLNVGGGLSDASADYRLGARVTWRPDWFADPREWSVR